MNIWKDEYTMFNTHHERLALILLWFQLVVIVCLIGVYFSSWIFFACLVGFIIIFAYYAFNIFMPAHYIRHSLTLAWILVACLYGVSIALYLDGTLVPLILMASAGLLSHSFNKMVSKL